MPATPAVARKSDFFIVGELIFIVLINGLKRNHDISERSRASHFFLSFSPDKTFSADKIFHRTMKKIFRKGEAVPGGR
jgi:hypothetical protein